MRSTPHCHSPILTTEIDIPEDLDPAPLFTLQNQRAETVALEQFRGSHNVVLYFYPVLR